MMQSIWWLTIAAYWLTALLCALCMWRTGGLDAKPGRVWLGLGIGMATLGLNKLVDGLGRVVALERAEAWQTGWYVERGGMQMWVMLISAVLLVGVAIFLALALKPLATRQWIALLGLLWLTGLVVVRAISLHRIDAFLFTPIGGIYPNWLLELGGIALVATPAALTLLTPRSHTLQAE